MNKMKRDSTVTSAVINTTAPSIVETMRIKKETIHLDKEFVAKLLFISTETEINTSRRSVSDRYMPSKKQEKDMLCVRATDIDGKLCIIQVWDNPSGPHAKYLEQLLR